MAKFEENVFNYMEEHSETRYENYDLLDFLDKIKFKFTRPFIHVTGTNGKGSICNYLNNIYVAAGYKVGLFSTPYFSNMCESIKINNVDINEEKIQEVYEKYIKEINKFELSKFELLTFVMFYYFEEQKVDLAVIEVCMGGEFDATNIEEAPVLAIINNVGIDHSDYLGKSISEIAQTKAGIIKYGGKVLVNILNDDAKSVVENVVKANKADLHYVNEFYRYGISTEGKLYVGYYPYGDFVVNTTSIIQRENVACAIEATLLLNKEFPVSAENIKEGLLKDGLQGRFSLFTKGNKIIIVDGAHNPDGMESLTKSLNYIKGSFKTTAIVGVFRDKNIEKMLAILGQNVDSIILTTFDHPRARTEEEFILFTEEYEFAGSYINKVKELLTGEEPEIILITGSLYFARLAIDELKSNGVI